MTAVSGVVGAGVDEVGRSLGLSLLRLYVSSRLVELHTAPPAFAGSVSERPIASPLARLQAIESTDVTNLRHEPVRLNDTESVLVAQLDGTRSREEVLALVNERATGEAVLDQFARPRCSSPDYRSMSSVSMLLPVSMPAPPSPKSVPDRR